MFLFCLGGAIAIGMPAMPVEFVFFEKHFRMQTRKIVFVYAQTRVTYPKPPYNTRKSNLWQFFKLWRDYSLDAYLNRTRLLLDLLR